MLHQRYGKLPWADLFAPDHRARRGRARRWPRRSPTTWPVSHRGFTSGRLGDRGDRELQEGLGAGGPHAGRGRGLRQSRPGPHLRLIAEGGRDGFYEGEIAETIDALLRAHRRLALQGRPGGAPRRVGRAALRSSYRGVDVWGLPPNSQGLSTLQMLNMLERFDLAGMGFQSTASAAPHGRGQAPGVRGPRPLLRRPGLRRRSPSSG